MNSIKAYAFWGIALIFGGVSAVVAAQGGNGYQVKADIDSASMFQGSKATVTVDFTGPLAKGATILFEQSDNPDVEIEAVKNETSLKELGNNRRQLQQQFVVQIFDSGLYTLPKIICISGNDTVIPASPVVKVDPIPLDSVNVVEENGELVDVKIHDFSDIASIDSKFFDFLPDWTQRYFLFILAALLVIGGFVFIYMKWLRHGRIPLVPVKKPTPPYDLAVMKLNKLQEQQLWQKGAEKEYYTQLTDILRTYLDGRFGINAMEMTTPQILHALQNNAVVAGEYSSLVNNILNEADFVKFAKARPQANENQRAFDDAMQFVQLTRPIETDNNEENASEDKAETSGDVESTADQSVSDKTNTNS